MAPRELCVCVCVCVCVCARARDWACNMPDPSFPTGDQTHAHCIGNAKSEAADHQRSPLGKLLLYYFEWFIS